MRVCSRCGEAKPDGDYYACRRLVCRACLCQESRANRSKRIDHYRSKERERAAASPERHRARTILWRRTHKDRLSAQQKLRYATRAGKLRRPSSCGLCGATGRIEGHHADYSKPLDVEWLCKPCHAKADQERRAA